MRVWKVLITVFVVTQSYIVHAHSGGLNSQGCHNNRKTGEYHCHSLGGLDADKRAKNATSYSRDQFGSGWTDTDGDCRDSRQEALITQSTNEVVFKTDRKCKVAQGRWISPYTGSVIYDSATIDIDHVVPLKWAWNHGANTWSQSKRESFANDPINLWAVENTLNRQKGAKGLDKWLPPNGRCPYASRFVRLVMIYGLSLPADYMAIQKLYCKNNIKYYQHVHVE